MLGTGITDASLRDLWTVAQVSWTQYEVFSMLYWGFLILGTIVGVIVISYILYNAYKYRTDAPQAEGKYDIDPEAIEAEDAPDDKVSRPQLGEIPSAATAGSGKKLFLSFFLSAVIVVLLVSASYYMLLFVEGTPDDHTTPAEAEVPEDIDAIEVMVVGEQFFFEYEYPSGETFDGELVVPEDRAIILNVTSCHPGTCDGDVMHNWGSPDARAKTDAIPGDYTQTWFMMEEPGEYQVVCYELCGPGHSNMRSDDELVVKPEDEFRDWCEDNDCMDEEELDGWLANTGGEN